MPVCLHGECHAAVTVIDLYKIMYSNFIFSQRDVNVQPKKNKKTKRHAHVVSPCFAAAMAYRINIRCGE